MRSHSHSEILLYWYYSLPGRDLILFNRIRNSSAIRRILRVVIASPKGAKQSLRLRSLLRTTQSVVKQSLRPPRNLRDCFGRLNGTPSIRLKVPSPMGEGAKICYNGTLVLWICLLTKVPNREPNKSNLPQKLRAYIANKTRLSTMIKAI